jgi:hypothetical protein
MNQFQLTINLDGAAFDDETADIEVARILRKAAIFIQPFRNLQRQQGNLLTLRDINGNYVGDIVVVHTEEP